MKISYSKKDIIDALIKVGIHKSDSLFIHSNLGFFGMPENVTDASGISKMFKDAIFDVIGIEGTLIVPTFSYSFCNDEIFDKKYTASVCGMFSEYIRKDPLAIRSDDANFSIAAMGKNAKHFTDNATQHSFGQNSFWERFMQSNGIICNFNFDSASTFIHYAEKKLNVSYRFDKLFTGKSVINGTQITKSFYHFVYDLDKPENGPNFTKFHKKAMDLGLCHIANLGKGQIVSISAKDAFDLISKEIQTNPSFLIKKNANGIK